MSALTFDGLALGQPAAPGFRLERHERQLSNEPTYFPVARDAVLDWQVQRRSGIRVVDHDGRDVGPVSEGGAAILLVSQFGLRLHAPVRVVRVIDAPDMAGFVYRAEPGHPEHGEEAFLVHLRPTETVSLELISVSRPAMPYALAAPLARRVQAKYTKRYLQALQT